ncbi:MAG TPA: hypothetical protein VFQ86_07595 [Arachidicoccus soli]|uniref:Viral A-type inclusion protein n=1 Tax=Arachidicoccus soli TaxID=2341117 RepID=A0A386HQT5_9BACT|nr:hypothetical protein [Arachidicoccus soli]AYD48133.1 hypothetical protein D6B99_11320 [Arachidicoccus soli]HEU0227584.1 hypothetical protein [Arachidicoccus soli]
MKIGLNKIIVSVCILAMAVTACNSGTNANSAEKKAKMLSPLDSMMQKVMDGHDRSMGKMGHLLINHKAIDHKIDSLQKSSASNNAAEIAILQAANKRIDSATGDMNKWMESFDMEMDKMDSTAKVNYLQKNMLLIDSITNQMQQASAFSDSILAH